MTRGTCMVAMYHYVRDSAATPFPAIRALPPALFEQQLDWLQQEYQLVDIDMLSAALSGRAALPPRAALLTFDDGLVDHYDVVLPILRRRGLTGVFFVAHDASGRKPRVLPVHKTHFLLAQLGADAFANAVVRECAAAGEAAGAASRARVFGADHWEHADERAIKDLLNYELSFEDAARVLDALFAEHIGEEEEFARTLYVGESHLAEMAAAGMAIGYHTRSHRMLSRLTRAEQERELGDGVRWIREVTGQRDVSFCFPWGGLRTYNDDTLDLLDRSGYSIAFNTVRRHVDVGRDGRFELPRLDTRDLPPYATPPPQPAAGTFEEA